MRCPSTFTSLDLAKDLGINFLSDLKTSINFLTDLVCICLGVVFSSFLFHEQGVSRLPQTAPSRAMRLRSLRAVRCLARQEARVVVETIALDLGQRAHLCQLLRLAKAGAVSGGDGDASLTNRERRSELSQSKPIGHPVPFYQLFLGRVALLNSTTDKSWYQLILTSQIWST